MNKELLIIFAESPLYILHSTENLNIRSRVDLYKKAFTYCCSITKGIRKEKYFFSDEGGYNDVSHLEQERKFLKLGSDKGEEMLNAFLKGFIKNYNKIVLIKNSSFEISSEIIEEAFNKLEDVDYVLGPLKDKSFYLLGMKKLNPFLFEKSVIDERETGLQIINELKESGESYFQLPELKEISEKDLGVLNYA